MDTAALLHSIFQCYRERRLADMLDHFDPGFRLIVALPDDPPGEPRRPRSKAEVALLTHKTLEEYEILEFLPATVTDGAISTQTTGQAKLRHRRSGAVVEIPFRQTWRFQDGKAVEVDHQHDLSHLSEFLKSIGEL
jgi:ketosteroid isomerase-like protein